MCAVEHIYSRNSINFLFKLLGLKYKIDLRSFYVPLPQEPKRLQSVEKWHAHFLAAEAYV